MGFRIPLGGGDKRKEHEHYTEGYNAGYAMAVDEMRRRSRSMEHYPDEDRRRSRSMEHHPDEDRRYGQDFYPVSEHRPIGFTHHPESPHDAHYPDMLMHMMGELKEGQEHIMRGLAETKSSLDPRLEGVLESAVKVLDNPPLTWTALMKHHDYAGIARMEGKELLAALEAKKPMQDIRKELTHTIAALFQLMTN